MSQLGRGQSISPMGRGPVNFPTTFWLVDILKSKGAIPYPKGRNLASHDLTMKSRGGI